MDYLVERASLFFMYNHDAIFYSTTKMDSIKNLDTILIVLIRKIKNGNDSIFVWILLHYSGKTFDNRSYFRYNHFSTGMIFTRTFFIFKISTSLETRIKTTLGRVFMVDREQKKKIYELSVFFLEIFLCLSLNSVYALRLEIF